MQVHSPRDIYGYRARIGYTSPPAATEVFPFEFYRMVPEGVSLVISTLAIVDMNKDEIDQSYQISLRAAREIARASVDLLVLGGLPINRSRGSDVDGLIRDVQSDIGVPVTTSTSAQMEALRILGARKVVIGHPFDASQDALFTRCLNDYEFETAAVKGAGFPADRLGLVPRSTAMGLARALMLQAPSADTMWMPCPHWAVAESIEPIEKEFGINVVTAHQSICWSALRRCAVNDAVTGYGRLLRHF
jgi:arylmalonate decarboxylase